MHRFNQEIIEHFPFPLVTTTSTGLRSNNSKYSQKSFKTQSSAGVQDNSEDRSKDTEDFELSGMRK